jgi:TPR repeat protein
MFFLLKLACCIIFVVNQSNAIDHIDLTDINPHEISPPPLNELLAQLKTSLNLSTADIEEESFEEFCLTSADKEAEQLFLLASNGSLRAYQQLKEKAQHTDPIACGFMLRYLLTLGPTYHCYDDLEANPQEYLSKCEQSLRDLSQQEHPYALEILGLLYEVGCGEVVPDIETAKVYTLRATLKRYSRAQNLMGYLLSKQKDPEALFWYIRAARNGSLTAIRNLGFELERLKFKELAVEFYKTAAIMGDSDSLLVIANYYKNLKDHQTAFLYLQKAMELNRVEAYFQIGSYLLESLSEEIGIEKPNPRSKISDYLSVAANYRYKTAFYGLAQYHETIKDEHEKINSLRRGDAIGDDSCTLALAKNLLETDLAESRKLFEKCLLLKVKNAEAWLAQCILQECDILIDEEELLFAKLYSS